MPNQSPESPMKVKSTKYWGSIAKGYLELAKLGLGHFLGIETNRVFLNEGKKSLLSLRDGNLLIASIWNIKHGLELAIKSLRVSIDKSYQKGHDLNSLFNDLKNNIKDLCIERDLQMMEKIVKKYYNCDFSRKTTFNDSQNDYFRFAEGKNGVLNYSFVHDVTQEDIRQFLNDINNIVIAFDLLEAEIRGFKSGLKLGINKEKTEKGLLSVITMKNPDYKN